MTTVDHAPPPGHEVGEPGARSHPDATTYVRIALVLGAITAVEVWVYTIEAVKAWLVPMLLVLSATKFVLVVGFYMHLRFDNRLFTYLFGFGLLVAASIITALLLLFGQYPFPAHVAAPAH